MRLRLHVVVEAAGVGVGLGLGLGVGAPQGVFEWIHYVFHQVARRVRGGGGGGGRGRALDTARRGFQGAKPLGPSAGGMAGVLE